MRSVVVAAIVLGGAVSAAPLCAQSGSGAALLTRSMAVYPALASYADTGTVVREAPGIVDRFRFATYFRRDSLDFLFDFRGVTFKSGPGPAMDGRYHQVVLWMIKGELQSFNRQLESHQTIPRAGGNQPAALQQAAINTAGTSTLIPALIFANANLNGTIRQIREVTEGGVESVNGRRCHTLIGTASEYYPSGAVTNVRQVMLWIDAETLLVRKVFEDTPEGYPEGAYSRLTITIDPRPNPPLDESRFQFTVPK